jgi:ATP synthase F1, gamma subunit
LRRLAAAASGEAGPLFEQREVKRTCYIVVGADKGLAGAFSSNINKAMAAIVAEKGRDAVTFLVTGRKPVEYLKRLRITPAGKWSGFSDKPQYHHAQTVMHEAVKRFMDGEVDEVCVLYTKFRSALVQDVTVSKLLPIDADLNEEEGVKEEYLFAPDSNQVLTSLVPTYLEAFVYNSLLQSAASELGARMTAMTSATDNAGELIDRLTVHYNKVRQAGITNELTEIVSGANALQ